MATRRGSEEVKTSINFIPKRSQRRLAIDLKKFGSFFRVKIIIFRTSSRVTQLKVTVAIWALRTFFPWPVTKKCLLKFFTIVSAAKLIYALKVFHIFVARFFHLQLKTKISLFFPLIHLKWKFSFPTWTKNNNSRKVLKEVAVNDLWLFNNMHIFRLFLLPFSALIAKSFSCTRM